MSITFLNKWLLAGERFGFPFLLNTMNNLVVCLIAWVLTRVPSLRPPTLAPRLLVTVVGPIGLLTALDIGFSNLALMRLPVSLHTILRGTTPAFVLLFAIAFGLQPFSAPLCASVLSVVLGGALAAVPTTARTGTHAAGWSEEEQQGLSYVLLSCVFSGLRWVLTQLLLSHTTTSDERRGERPSDPSERRGERPSAREAIHSSPLASIFYISPACAAGSLLGALLFERAALASPAFRSLSAFGCALLLPVCAVACGVFTLLMCEYALVSLTSSLSLSVLGVLKEMATLLIASVVLGDQVTRANLAGFGIVVCGLLMYHVIQWRDEQRWRRDERYEEGRRDERYEGRRDERYEERWRRDERYEEGYEGGGDTIASVAAAEEEAAKAKGRYEGAVSAA